MSEERDVFVAVVDRSPVAFVAVALNAFHERMGLIDIVGVDPDYQRRGISSRLTEYATEHMQRCGNGYRGGRNRRGPWSRTCAGGI
ncbi:MAG TPA: GNAT family N-acetyltransferase [Gaiellaceae bacterium]|nr:GNAT family N-acetyltransferase [Gaiellaceae bacterium]